MNLRSTLATSAAAVAIMAGGTAQAADDFYVSIFGGLSTFDDEIPFQTSQSNSGTLGGTFVGSATTLKGGSITFNTAGAFPVWGYVGIGSGSIGIFTSYALTAFAPFSTTRKIGFYKVIGTRYDAFSVAHNSYFQWEDDFDTGFVVGAALGTELADGWRGELEVAYRQADVSGGGKFNRRINGNFYQNISFPTATNFIYLYIKSASAYIPTSIGPTVVNQVYGASGYYVTKLPVSSASKTGTILAAAKTGYGPIPYAKITLPNAGSATGNISSGGDAQVWSLMANIWHDFDFMGLNPEGVVTFAGAGIGVASLDLEYNASAGTYFGGTIGYGLDDSGVGIAYQLGAGIGFDLGGGSMLTAQYRWFGTSDIDVGNTDLRVESHNALVSFSVPIGALIP